MKKLLTILLMLILTSAACAEGVPDNWYEVFVRSYQDSDGDGLGDLNGLRSRLDYIEDMGWRGLWLMPIMPSPSYHKYDVTDYRAVDGQYGTLEDLRALLDDAHARGISTPPPFIPGPSKPPRPLRTGTGTARISTITISTSPAAAASRPWGIPAGSMRRPLPGAACPI